MMGGIIALTCAGGWPTLPKCELFLDNTSRWALHNLSEFGEILQKVGIKEESLGRIRLARGVVGKTSYVAAAMMFVLALVAFGLKGANAALLTVGAFAVIAFVIYLILVLRFATRNPGLALLEGAELVQWRQMEMGVQGQIAPPSGPNVPPPGQTPLISPTGEVK